MPEVDELEMESRVEEILNRRPAVGLAVGVVRNGRLEFFRGHGLADIASNTPVTEDTVFRIGSLTKTVTAIAMMQLWEQGLLNLDAPAGNYLRAYALVPAKDNHRPATARHLLTHTSGLPELVHPSRAYKPILGETVAFGRRVPALAEFYRGHLHQVAEPGTRLTYSNHNFATLGQIVEDVSGTPLDRYVREHIFAPLGMAERLMIRPFTPVPSLSRGFPLRPDDDSDPYVFRVDLSDVGIGTSRVVFSQEPRAEATSLHLDFASLSFDRQPAISNPRPWGAAALAAPAVATTATAVRRHRRLNTGAST